MKTLLLAGVTALLLATASAASPALNTQSRPRGVAPADAARYRGPSFACADGGGPAGATLAIVNDDYCDCADGSDEPGTSACPNARFHCANVGHRPLTLNASAVDDGVCDCCDGSDEPAGGCPSTCTAEGAAALAAAEARLAGVRAGLAAKAKAATRARRERAAWARTLARAEADVAAADAAVEAARPAKEAADKEEEAERKAREEKEGKKEDEKKEEAAATDAAPAADAPPPAPAADDDDDPEAAGRRIAAQWTHDKSAALGDEDPAEAAAADAVAAAAADAAAADAAAHTLTARLLTWAAGLAAKLRPPPPLTPREAARRSFAEAEAAATAAKSARDAAAARAALDLGPAAAFHPLLGACVTARVDKYTYRVCPFDRAEQEDGGGGHPVSLGAWAGWGDEAPADADADAEAPSPPPPAVDGALPPPAYRTMRFADGAHCWNGPPRSLTVAVECGPADSLARVTEPSRCEYRAVLTTPAACGEEEEAAAARQVAAARAAAAGEEGGAHDVSEL